MHVELASFPIHGTAPGVASNREEVVTVCAIFESLIVSLLPLVCGYAGAQLVSRLLRMPESILMAIIAILSSVGAFAAWAIRAARWS